MVKEKIVLYKLPLKIYGLTIFYGIVGSLIFQLTIDFTFHFLDFFQITLLFIIASLIAIPFYLLSVRFCTKNQILLKVISCFVVGFFTAYTIPFFGDITMGQREFCNDTMLAKEAFFILQDCPLNMSFFVFFFMIGMVITAFLLFTHFLVWALQKFYYLFKSKAIS